jgi:cation transport regulator ChaB
MPYKSIDGLPETVRNTLTEEEQEKFLEVFNSVLEEGMSEEEAFAIAWSSVVGAMDSSRVVKDKFILAPGTYQLASGDGNITPQNVADTVRVINRRNELSVPVPLKYEHSEERRSIPLGYLANAYEKNGEAFADLHIVLDAIECGEDGGQRVLLTKDQLAVALENNILGLSFEAFRDVKKESYYGPETISFEPASWAVLPPGILPAVPRNKLAASREQKGELVVGLVQTSTLNTDRCEAADKREDMMTLEEALEKIAELEEVVKGLQGELAEFESSDEEEETTEDEASEDAGNETSEKDLEAELKSAQERIAELEDERAQIELAALNKRVEELLTKVSGKLVVGQRKELIKEMASIDSPSQKMAVLGHLDSILPELTVEEAQLEVEQNPDESPQLARVRAAEKLADEKGIAFSEAYIQLKGE